MSWGKGGTLQRSAAPCITLRCHLSGKKSTALPPVSHCKKQSNPFLIVLLPQHRHPSSEGQAAPLGVLACLLPVQKLSVTCWHVACCSLAYTESCKAQRTLPLSGSLSGVWRLLVCALGYPGLYADSLACLHCWMPCKRCALRRRLLHVTLGTTKQTWSDTPFWCSLREMGSG